MADVHDFDRASFDLGWRASRTGFASFVGVAEPPGAGLERAWAARHEIAATARYAPTNRSEGGGDG